MQRGEAPKDILICMPSDRLHAAQDMFKGITAHVAKHHLPWTPSVYSTDELADFIKYKWFREKNILGIIGHLHPTVHDFIENSNSIYGVEISRFRSTTSTKISTICSEESHYGRIAAHFARDHGYDRMVLYGRAGVRYRDSRLFPAMALCQRLNIPCIRIELDKDLPTETAEKKLANALRSPGRSTIVFTFTDGEANWITELCLALRIAVPDEVAILGCQDEPSYRRTGRLTLSSIGIPWPYVGRSAALDLHRLSCGQQASSTPTLINPTHVTERETTKPFGGYSKKIKDLVDIINNNPQKPWTSDSLAHAIGISRRTLYRRCNEKGLNPMTLARKRRIYSASKLLIKSSANIQEISNGLGFTSPNAFARTFKDVYGMSPNEFRQRNSGVDSEH